MGPNKILLQKTELRDNWQMLLKSNSQFDDKIISTFFRIPQLWHCFSGSS